MKKSFLVVALLITAFASWSQRVDLKLNLEVGKTYVQATNSYSTIEQTISGQKMTIKMGLKGTVEYVVKVANAERYEMDVTYKSLTMSMQMPQGSMEFSSEKEGEQDILSKILSAMKGKPFQVTMLRNGKVIGAKNIETIFDAAIEKLPQLSETQMKQIKEQILKAYGADAFKGNIEMVTAIFPDKSVALSDSWTVNTKLSAGMAANMSTVYQLAAMTSDYMLIKGDSKITTENKDAYMESNGMKMRYDMTGTMISEIKIDPKTGWILEAKIDQVLQGNAHIKENDQLPNGMTIPMLMNNDMLITNRSN